jgi:hypothetical protein
MHKLSDDFAPWFEADRQRRGDFSRSLLRTKLWEPERWLHRNIGGHLTPVVIHGGQPYFVDNVRIAKIWGYREPQNDHSERFGMNRKDLQNVIALGEGFTTEFKRAGTSG